MIILQLLNITPTYKALITCAVLLLFVNKNLAAVLIVVVAAFALCSYGLAGFVMCGLSLRNAKLAEATILSLAESYDITFIPIGEYIGAARLDLIPRSISKLKVAYCTPKRGDVSYLNAYLAFPQAALIEDSTFVIFDKAPKDTTAVYEFFLLHELGHMAFSGFQHVANKEVTLLRVSLLYLPCVFLIDSIYWMGFVWLVILFHAIVEGRSIDSEISADHFAARMLFEKYGFNRMRRVVERVIANHFQDGSDAGIGYPTRAKNLREYLSKIAELDALPTSRAEKGVSIVSSLSRSSRILMGDQEANDYLGYKKTALITVVMASVAVAPFVMALINRDLMLKNLAPAMFLGLIANIVGWALVTLAERRVHAYMHYSFMSIERIEHAMQSRRDAPHLLGRSA